MAATAQTTAKILLAGGAFAAGLAVAWLALRPDAAPGPEAALPVIEGDFTLLDKDATPVPWRDIGGRTQLVFFGFTHCPEACPATLAKASRALGLLGEEARGMRVVFISVDPQRDTPARLAEYLAPFGTAVTGYTGDPGGIAAAAAAFHVFYEKLEPMADGGYMVNHTATLFLLGAGDEILGIIPYGASPEEIAGAIRRGASTGTPENLRTRS